MTTIRVRFNPPTGPVEGQVRFTPRHDKDNRPLAVGQDIISGDTGWLNVPLEGREIEVRRTEPGWHYVIQGKASGAPSFSTTVLVPSEGTIDFEQLVRYDPKAGMAYEPDPNWWAWVKKVADLKGVPGDPGQDGEDGEDGEDGSDGLSAYQIAVRNGYNGTEQDWLASLEGPVGEPGPNGKTAYQIAIEGGFEGTPAEWLESLTGPEGPGATDEAVASYVRGDTETAGAIAERIQDGNTGRVVRVEDFGPAGTSDDSETIQAFFDYLNDNGGIGVAAGEYTHASSIILTDHNNYMVTGGGTFKLRASAHVNIFNILRPVNITFENIRFDGGFSVTGFGSHAYSVNQGLETRFIDCHSYDFRNSGGLFTSNGTGNRHRNLMRGCTCDGMGVANNGFLFSSQVDSYMVDCSAKGIGTDSTNSPSYAIQLKNESVNSHIVNCTADGAKGGIVFASDADHGPERCTASGSVVNCEEAVILGKTFNSRITAFVDMSGLGSSSRGVRFSGGSNGNVVEADVSNVPSGAFAVNSRSNNNSVILRRVSLQGGGKIAQWDNNTTGMHLTIGEMDPFTASFHTLIENNGNATGNPVTSIHHLGSAHPTSGAAFLRMFPDGDGSTWVSASSNAMTLRHKGTDWFSFNSGSAFVTPGSDNTLDFGRASARWKQVYAATSTISTSDGREKRDITTELAPELRAWARVEFVKYRWREAVETKGSGARYHFGVIAQQVKAAFEAEGIDPFEYGVLCYDEWEAEEAEAGEATTAPVKAGNRYGVRYEEALALEAAYTRARMDAIENRGH